MSPLFFGWNDLQLSRRGRNALGIAQRGLAIPALWRLFRVGDANVFYDRLVLRERFMFEGEEPAKYVLAFHVFREVFEHAALHNHRYPGMIFPFAQNAPPGTPLYRMPWEIRVGDETVKTGTHVVKSGEPYGFTDALGVWHAIQGIRPHMSFVFTDLSAPPQRENRLEFRELPRELTRAVCAELCEATLLLSKIEL